MKRFSLVFFFLLAFYAGTLSGQAQNIPNLALKQPAVASSSQDATTYPASAAVDGDAGTRWSSQGKHDPEWIYVDLGSIVAFDRVKLTWEAAYGKDYLLQISNDAANWTTIRTVTGNTNLANDFSQLNAKARYVRVYGTARGLQEYGYSLFEIGVYPVSNLAFNKPGTASSSLGGNTTDKAFDEQSGTRWESTQDHDPEWLYVDLGQVSTINEITLTWERAAGKDFLVQVSNNATDWTTIQTVTGNSALTNDYSGLNVQGRYVRMYGTARTTQYGYSLFEFAVYGTGREAPLTPLPVELTYFRAAAEKAGMRLRWATAMEKDNQGFELQRSTNGTSFVRFAFVAGAGSSSTPHTYQYLDASVPAAGLVYYRLKQLDQNGTTTYTPVVAVRYAGPEAAQVAYSLYPNPTPDEAHLDWTTQAPGTVVVQLTNSQGRPVYQHTQSEMPGQNSLRLDLRPYAAGYYFLTLRGPAGLLYQSKVVKAQ